MMDSRSSMAFQAYLQDPLDHTYRPFQDNRGLDGAETAAENGNAFSSQLFRDSMNQIHLDHGIQQFHSLGGHPFSSIPMILPEQLPVSGTHDAAEQFGIHCKKQEDADTACRPRLTADQTAILEEYYSHTPRPTTQQKKQHAIQLGLTQEKVNNWFQNRRAKSKQQGRTRREFEILPISQQQFVETTGEYPQSTMASSPLQYSDIVTPIPLHPTGIPHQLSLEHAALNEQPWAQNIEACVPTSLEEEAKATKVKDLDNSSSISNNAMVLTPTSGSFDFIDSAPTTNGFSIHNWFEPRYTEEPLGLGHSGDARQLLLQQAPTPTGIEMQDVGQASNGNDALVKSNATTGQAPHHDIRSNQEVEHGQSPRGSSHNSPAASVPHMSMTSEAFSRRGSVSSELLNNFNTIHIQRRPSQQTSDEEIFKTPELPAQNLAARRKRQRPAALVAMRTASACAPQINSPTGKDAPLPQSVRRIKSAGNSLNISKGRVSKLAGSPAQRSPLNVSTFREASTLERFQANVGRMSERRGSLFSLDQQPHSPMVDTQSQCMQQVQSTNSPTEYDNGWQMVSPSDSVSAPPLSASFTQKSFEDGSHATSPPITPFVPHATYMNQWCEETVPQSAPAHMTTFGNYSPPMPPQPITPSGYFLPPGHIPDNLFFPQSHTLPPQIYAPVMGGPAVYDFESRHQQQPQIVRPCSSPGGHFTFFAMPPPQPPKELEVVMTTFPAPAKNQGQNSLPKMRLPQQFTFQNSGPRDYED